MRSVTAQLRSLLEKRQVVMEAGVYDCVSAKAAAEAGFDSLLLTGYGVSASLLGKPDASFLGLTDVAMVCSRIAASVDLPVIVDVDTGFGNAVNVAHSVRVLEDAGAAGVHLEDQVTPKRCVGSVTSVDTVAMDEAVGKIQAAAEARRDSDFVIEAACMDSEQATALDRVSAYSAAGADIVGCMAFHTPDGLKQVQGATDKPVYVVYTDPPGWITPGQMAELGIRGVAIFAVETLLVAYGTMLEALKFLRNSGRFQDGVERVKLAEFGKFIGFPQLTELELKYLPETLAHVFQEDQGLTLRS